MQAVYKVVYFDPDGPNFNMESFTALAPNATMAIKKCDHKKMFKKYRVESVEMITYIDP